MQHLISLYHWQRCWYILHDGIEKKRIEALDALSLSPLHNDNAAPVSHCDLHVIVQQDEVPSALCSLGELNHCHTIISLQTRNILFQAYSYFIFQDFCRVQSLILGSSQNPEGQIDNAEKPRYPRTISGLARMQAERM